MPTGRYDADYYAGFETTGRHSADVIVPLLLAHTDAASVVDVGCGAGYFLDAFAAHGVTDRLGVDGPFNDGAVVRARGHDYVAVDLQLDALDLGRRFDLAICLEVAEHLRPQHGARLVDGLVASADVVAFSAAYPGQPGEGHVNLRLPSAWAAEFARHGYHPVDVIRPRTWDDPRVAFYYSQNLRVYAAGPQEPVPLMDAAHPGLIAAMLEAHERTPGREALGLAVAAMRRRLGS